MVKSLTAYRRSTPRLLFLPPTTGVATVTLRWLRATLGLDSFSALGNTEKRYTELLAQAALGGDEAVLEKVTKALCDNGVLPDELARWGC